MRVRSIDGHLQFLGNTSKHHLWVKELKHFSTSNLVLNFFCNERIPTESYCLKKEFRTKSVRGEISFTPIKFEKEMEKLKDDQTASHSLEVEKNSFTQCFCVLIENIRFLCFCKKSWI